MGNGENSEAEQYAYEYELLEKLQLVFKIHGRDKRGRILLTILAKFFPGRMVSAEALKKYLEEKIYPRLLDKDKGGPQFSVLYIHTDVQKAENFPGISALRSVYDDMPPSVKANLESVYFVHPDLQSRLFLATFGRFFFSGGGGGLYGKVKYISRLDYLWEHVRRNEIQVPRYVREHDEDLEYRPMMDYGLESDHPRVYGAPVSSSSVDSPVATYSMRCIS